MQCEDFLEEYALACEYDQAGYEHTPLGIGLWTSFWVSIQVVGNGLLLLNKIILSKTCPDILYFQVRVGYISNTCIKICSQLFNCKQNRAIGIVLGLARMRIFHLQQWLDNYNKITTTMHVVYFLFSHQFLPTAYKISSFIQTHA